MNRIRKLAAFIAAAIVLCVPCHAVDVLSELSDSIGVETLENSLPDAAQDAFGSMQVSDLTDLSRRVEQLWVYITGQSHDLFLSAVRGGVRLLLAVLFLSLCSFLTESSVVRLASAAAVALACMQSVESCAAVAVETMESMVTFSHALLPCLSMAAVAGGAVTSAGAVFAVSMLFMDGVLVAEQTVAMPLVFTYSAVLLAGEATDNPLLRSLSGLIRTVVKWVMILLTSAFTVYLSVTGILSGTVDAAAAKAAKTVFSAALPVVGGILSDASAALMSGANILKTGVGVMGLLATIAVCAVPYLTLGSHYLVYQIAGGMASAFCDRQLGGVIRGLGDAFAFLLGMVGSASVVLFVSIISMMKAVQIG